jgi:insecticidal toxin complex protein TccC
MSSALHQYTPTLSVIDPRGLALRSVAFHRLQVGDLPEARIQRRSYDGAGLLRAQWDARLWAAGGEAGEPNQRSVYSLSGEVLRTENVDAGWRIGLFGDARQALERWDGRQTHQRTLYDEQIRPLSVYQQLAGEPERCVQCFQYGDSTQTDSNCCGRPIRHDDPAGSRAFPGYDLLGKGVAEVQRFLVNMNAPDWPESVVDRDALLEVDDQGAPVTYCTAWRHDAAGGQLSQVDALGNDQLSQYDLAGQLSRKRLKTVGDTTSTSLMEVLEYDAFGQVTAERAGNGVTTTVIYSEADGRLQQLKAIRLTDGHVLQDLQYIQDPVGNVTSIEDGAQPTDWFNGEQVDPVSAYRYDTLYQLIEARGRESVQAGIRPGLPTLAGPPGTPDASRWRNYRQTYTYDAGGNLEALTHTQAATRTMKVAERGNRSLLWLEGLPEPDLGNGFDANGNQQILEGTQALLWDGRNLLQRVTQVLREDGQNDDEVYVYDGAGQRRRKMRSQQARALVHVAEVRYLPGLELRTNTATGEELQVVAVSAGRSQVRRLHWAQGKKALPVPQIRYSVDDHLGSSALELDDQGTVISHEGYYPYGGTAWWAARTRLEASDKTQRYSGKERDATGLYYYGFRYYAPWLQRWINPDPAGNVDGMNLFCMVRNNPIRYKDTDGRMLRSANQQPTREQDKPETGNEAGPSNVVNFPPSIGLASAKTYATSTGNNKIPDFFRVDISPPSHILAYGFKGNNTGRIVKLFGDDTVFAAQSLEGIDEFRSEISHVKQNMFGDARKYYFEEKVVNGYIREIQKPLNLYKISLPKDHPHYVLSSFFSGEGSIETSLNASYGERYIARLKAKADGSYEREFTSYSEHLKGYALNYNATKEVQIKGPIGPDFITYIPPADEVFMRQPIQTIKKAA